jgi:hypothetical protein
MSPTGDLHVTFIFLWEDVALSLLRHSCVLPWPGTLLGAAHPETHGSMSNCRQFLRGVTVVWLSLWFCWNPEGCTSQCSLHSAPIFRLLLKVAVNGTHQCESLNFCGAHRPNVVAVKQQATKVACFESRCRVGETSCATVLAQDLCYSDPLSLVLTFTTHTVAVRIFVDS